MKSHLDIGRVAFDPKTLMVDESAFNNGADWKEFYGEVQEELPPKMPKPRGQSCSTPDPEHIIDEPRKVNQGSFEAGDQCSTFMVSIEIPPFVGKKLSFLTALSTMCIIKSFGIRWNGRL
jgi:hypothetical protein